MRVEGQTKRSGLFLSRHWANVAPLPPAYHFVPGRTRASALRIVTRALPELERHYAESVDCVSPKNVSPKNVSLAQINLTATRHCRAGSFLQLLNASRALFLEAVICHHARGCGDYVKSVSRASSSIASASAKASRAASTDTCGLREASISARLSIGVFEPYFRFT